MGEIMVEVLKRPMLEVVQKHTLAPLMCIVRLLNHAALLLVVTLSVYAQDPVRPLSRSDRAFMTELYQRGHGEQALAQLARGRTSNPIILDYSERLERDHGAIGTLIEETAHHHLIPLKETLTQEGLTTLQELEKLSGPRFEDTFMRRALTEHRTTIGRLEEEVRNCQNKEVCSIAREALGRGREHLALAQRYELVGAPPPPGVVRTMPGGDR